MPVLKGTKGFYSYEISDHVAHNIKSWLEYGFLEMGAFTPITSNVEASGYSYLKRVYDDRYGENRVFEGLGEWVWESGVVPLDSSSTTFQPSGIYVNDTFYSLATSGSYSHIVDFRNGRIIFDADIPESDIVRCEYVSRDIAIYLSDSPQWRRMVDIYTDVFNNLDSMSPSGVAQVLKENRIWLPCVVIETENVTNSALQLGGGEIASCSTEFHIFSDKPFSSKRISDTIVNQDEKRIDFYDVNVAPYPLKWNGTLASGALTYPILSARNGPYFWTYADLSEMTGGPTAEDTDVYRAEVRGIVEVARYLSTY